MYKKAVTILVFITLLSSMSSGQIPQKISYQGVLTDSGGVLVPNGVYSLSFSIYNVDVGGSAIWTENQSAEITNGLFNVNLGEITTLNLAFDEPYWLGVTVAAGTELAPRIELTASGYSLNTMSIVDNSISTIKIVDGAVTQGKLAPGISLPPGGIAGGDLTGTYPDPIIADNAVNAAKIQDGQVGTNDLADASVTQVKLGPGVSLPPGGVAGGDLTGTYPNPTVNGIQGRLLDLTPPIQGQVLKWNGATWYPQDDNVGSSVWATSGNNIYNTNTDFVGIGTTTPIRKLHLNGSTSDEIALFRNNHSPGLGLRVSLAGIDAPTALMLSTTNAAGTTSGASIDFDGTRVGGIRTLSSRISGFLTDPSTAYNGALTFHTRGDGVVAERMRINEWGNVGIGTMNPENGRLEVIGGGSTGIDVSSTALNAIHANSTAGGGYAAGYFTASNSGTYGVWAQSNDYDALYAWSQSPGHSALRALGSNNAYAGIFEGDVGIGTSSPVSRLHMAYPSGVGNGFTMQNLSDSDQWEIYVYSTNDLTLFYNGAQRGAFDDVSGNYVPTSDEKVKKDIEYLDNELEKIMKLKPAKYHFIEQESSDQRKYYGLVAQEVKKVFPELAVYFDEFDQYGVSYTEFIPLLISGMQQQQKQIDQLRNELNELINKLPK